MRVLVCLEVRLAALVVVVLTSKWIMMVLVVELGVTVHVVAVVAAVLAVAVRVGLVVGTLGRRIMRFYKGTGTVASSCME